MNVRVACPSCSASYGISDVYVGRTARCNRCGHVFPLSGSTLDQPEALELDEPLPERPELRVGQEFAGRYLIEGKLGAGGMGSVFRARDKDLGRVVALKVPHFRLNEDSETVRRFEREARIAAGFDHPNLCPVYDVGRADGVRYLTMPFIEGEALSAVLRSGPMDYARAAGIAHAIAVALSEAHAKGVIHRDLKPANVLIHPKRGPVVVDFGLARDEDADDSRRTRTGTLLGTPAYMSPEQVDGDMKAVGPRTDVYALGVLLYEMIAGRAPFEGNNISAILVKIKIEPPRHPRALRPDVDNELATIALKAMSKDPAERYPSMQAMAAELGRWIDHPSRAPKRGPHPDPRGDQVTPRPRRRLALLASMAMVVALLAVGGGVASWFWADRGSVRLAIADPHSIHTLLIDGHKVPSDSIGGSIELSTGDHTVMVVRSEAKPWTQSFTIKRGEITDLIVPMAHSVPVPGPSETPGTLPVEVGDVERPGKIPPPSAATSVLSAGSQAGDSWGGSEVGFTLRWCPSGSFLMGSPLGEPGRDNSDEDQVFVNLGHGFWMGEHEVTQGLYERITGSNPSTFSANGTGSDSVTDVDSTTLPVESLTWDEATEFCRLLTSREQAAGRLPFDWEYRLPSEAEWEYACRAGTTTATAFGDSLGGTQACFNGAIPFNGAPTSPAPVRPEPVGRFAANAWGLRDMHGNVYEWCLDGYATSLPGGVDPVAPAAERRVFRGGSWPSEGLGCRSAFRNRDVPGSRLNYTGFRVVAAPLGTAVESTAPEPPADSIPVDPKRPPVTPIPRDGSRPAVTPSPFADAVVPPAPAGEGVAEGSFAGETLERPEVGISLRWCPPGTFRMGSSLKEPDRSFDEGPVEVTLTRGFWIAASEVTQDQYRVITGANPSAFSSDGESRESVAGLSGGTGNFPVETVSWDDATNFCRLLTTRESDAGRLPAGWEYRLPTEAEWEYACRAGTTTATAFGRDLGGAQANFDGNYPYNGSRADPTYLERTAAVMSYAPNEWGLYDMHGNVYEWCLDTYSGALVGGTDPLALDGSGRSARGGCWASLGASCRSAYRFLPDNAGSTVGFRIVLARPLP